MKMTLKEAKQIMSNHKMECDECPFGADLGSCQLPGTACADVALMAGKMLLAEAQQDAFDMATLLELWAEKRGGGVNTVAEAQRIQKKYEME